MIEDKVVNRSEDKSVEDDMFLFIAKLYSNNSITKIVANEIVDDLLKFTGSIKEFFKDQLKRKFRLNFIKLLTNVYTSIVLIKLIQNLNTLNTSNKVTIL